MSPIMVDFPDPDGPTIAVTVPGWDLKLRSFRTVFPAS